MKNLVFVILGLLLVVSAQGIEVINPSFEDPGTGKTPDLTTVPGWDNITGAAGVEDGHAPAATDGTWYMYAGQDAWASQLTNYTVAAGEAYQLTVDVTCTFQNNPDTQATIELYYDDNGTAVTMDSATIVFEWNGGGSGDKPGPYVLSLLVLSADHPDAIGKTLGIKLGGSVYAKQWIGYDNVRLDSTLVYSPTPIDGEVLVDKDSDLSWVIAPSVDSSIVYLRPVDANFIDTANNVLDGIAVTAPATSIDPGTLLPETQYFWKVDATEPNTVAPYTPILHEGAVWSFTTAPDVPVIITQPVSQTVETGSLASLSIEQSNGTSFQWYKDGAPVAGATSETYEIASVQKSDEGVYYCEVSNGAGTVASEAAMLWTTRVYAHWDFNDTLVDTEDGWIGVYTDPNIANPAAPTAVYDATSILGDKSLKLDPDELHVVITDSNELFNFYPFGYTVAAWVQTSNSTEWQVLASKESETDSGWGIWSNVEGYPVSVLRKPGNDNHTGTTWIADGLWHYVVSQYDPQTQTVKTFVDGALENESGQFSTIPLSEAAVSIGAVIDRSEGYFPWSGLIDDLTIWTYAISAEEVATLYGDITGIQTCVNPPMFDYANGDTGLVIGDEGFVGDCVVNMHDFVLFALEWFESGLYPAL